jgi:hypothetical protein
MNASLDHGMRKGPVRRLLHCAMTFIFNSKYHTVPPCHAGAKSPVPFPQNDSFEICQLKNICFELYDIIDTVFGRIVRLSCLFELFRTLLLYIIIFFILIIIMYYYHHLWFKFLYSAEVPASTRRCNELWLTWRCDPVFRWRMDLDHPLHQLPSNEWTFANGHVRHSATLGDLSNAKPHEGPYEGQTNWEPGA